MRNCSVVSESAVVDQKARLKGEVNIGERSVVSHDAILNANQNLILVGNNVEIGSYTSIESKGQNKHTFICNNVQIGSHVKMINATIEEQVKIMDGAVIMDNVFIASNSVVGEKTIIAPDSIVLEGTVCEAGCMYAGVPAVKVDSLPQTNSLKKILRRLNR